MTEYISKKAVTNMFPVFGQYGETDGENEAYKAGFMDALKTIAAFPAADVRLERHEQWVDGHGERNYFGGIIFANAACSGCGKRSEMTDYPSLLPYCPYCGAKMNEEVGGER